jgi:hypothetical protein
MFHTRTKDGAFLSALFDAAGPHVLRGEIVQEWDAFLVIGIEALVPVPRPFERRNERGLDAGVVVLQDVGCIIVQRGNDHIAARIVLDLVRELKWQHQPVRLTHYQFTPIRRDIVENRWKSGEGCRNRCSASSSGSRARRFAWR